ncbi:MAG TPA: bifunctional diguanylate cyclase/phosphodiesterase, partial [Acidimicrobiales bacterium]|nr:bifunctional diguanylate cyclase/phosphodiesterase [Acidimicrobiales bacterium]
RALERRLAFQATHDEMTGLPNRRQLVDRLQRAVAAARSGDHEVAVIELDIDDFGSVNEALGHDGGDRVLRAVAERAARALRPCDLISRYGGDELVVVAPVTGGLPEALDLVSALQGALREPVPTGRGRLALSAAFGVAVGVDLGEALLRAADVAMYEAKEAGRGQVGVFDAGLRAQRQRTREVVAALGEALDAGQLTAHFQPVVDVATGRLAGFEALARIEHPARGLIGPAEFVPAAEDSGLIDRLGLAVLDQACAALATWSAEPGPPLTLAVNVSARQLEGAGFVDAVAAAVSRHGVATDQVCLEVTESTMTEQATALRALRDLRDLGVRVALDDFGTGYSSLDRLRRLPIDRLKVDRTFIQHLPSDRASQVIVGAVVALARALGLDVVAEGVELHAQLDALRELACPAAQGFLWSPAVPAPAALAMVRAGEGWAAPGLVAG